MLRTILRFVPVVAILATVVVVEPALAGSAPMRPNVMDLTLEHAGESYRMRVPVEAVASAGGTRDLWYSAELRARRLRYQVRLRAGDGADAVDLKVEIRFTSGAEVDLDARVPWRPGKHLVGELATDGGRATLTARLHSDR